MPHLVIRRSRRKQAKQQNWRKATAWLTIAVVVVLLAAAAAYGGHIGYRWYQTMRHHRMIWMANAALENGDTQSASIHAQRALQLDPRDVDGSLIMAKIVEGACPDEAIPWRHLVLKNRPHDLENAVALAELELKIGRIAEAQKLLDKLQPETTNAPEYHKVAGLMALAKNNPLKAEEHFARSLQLYPDNGEYQLMLSKAQLLTGGPKKRLEARERMMRVARIKTLRSKALGAVISDMLKTNEPDAALMLADTLESDPAASFEDHLVRLDVAYRLKTPDFTTALHSLQEKSLGSTDQILLLISWLQDHGLSLLALDWIKGMPQRIANDARLKLAAAQAYAGIQQWEPANELLATQSDWGDSKFLALALQARICREQGRQAQFQTSWNAAAVEAGKSQSALIVLSRIAESWKWPDQSEAVLWKILDRPCPPDWVFRSLKRRCMERLDSGGLQKLWLRKHELDPSETSTMNNLAYVLLLRGEREEEAHKMAAEVYLSNQTNPHFASTYAYSLYRQGKNQESLKVLSTLPVEEIQDPSNAVCYAAVLTALNEKDKAAKLLPGIERARLLPEEIKLLDLVERMLKAP